MTDHFIRLEQVLLRFRTHAARTRSLKESVVNVVMRRRYGPPPREVIALRDVTLNVADGQRLGIVGDNGAGKTTLLKVVSRIYPPTAGRVSVRGFLVPLLEVGVGANPELSGAENVFLTGAILGLPRHVMARQLDEILDFAELREFADTPLKYYSSGMAQRLAFTVATQIRPEILLLDEVFSVGDIHWIEKARARMQALIDRAAILVLVSHQMDLIERYCNRAVWIESGRIAADGEPAAIIDSYRRSSDGRA